MSQTANSPYDSITFGKSLLLRVDGAIGAMSLSPNGRDAVLAGRRGLFIIDLDDPFTTPRWLHHITSWEVADVQWSPHHLAKPSWCISTSNQKALLWDLARPSNNAILNVLHQHTRAITDINFHPFDPEILATCSIDTFIFQWDMRTPRKPVAQWAEWRAGTTQVKWNHANPYEIASSHDNNFYIWDSRNGSLPVLKVNKAHNAKINGLDFSNGISNIITCSNDKLIRFWDLSTDKARNLANSFNFFDDKSINRRSLDPTVIINTEFPVARARNLPFGKDRACGVMPLRGGQDAVHILNYDGAFNKAKATGKTQTIQGDPIHSFKGHSGPIKDFLWRHQHENYDGFENKHNWKEYQLVTWSSQDYDLKLWPEDDLYEKINYNPTHQKILDDLINEELDSESVVKSNALISENIDDESVEPSTPNAERFSYKYNTYCIEPPVTIEDLKNNSSGDILSSITKFKLAKSHKQSNVSQLNHLDWISGVRIGHINNHDKNASINDSEDGPTNLGEEVSIVGHKFPKIRFEKISVSTGHLVVSLRGPVPVIASNNTHKNSASDSNASGTEENTVIDKEAKRDSKSETITATSTTTNMPGLGSVNHNNSIQNSEDITSTPANTSTVINNEDTVAEQKLVFIRLEVRFPKNYPYLEELGKVSSSRRFAKLQKSNTIKFDIEETHELNLSIKKDMLKHLEEIANFFTNKYKKFCLEPCLRYLLGDKIDLSDSLMLENTRTESNDENGESELIQEIGTEGWADDLINQQPDVDYNAMKDDSSSSEDEDEDDLIPVINDNLAGSGELNGYDNGTSLNDKGGINEGTSDAPLMNTFDSTPIPKGCGAVWSNTGQLVCFLTKRNNEPDKTVQRFKFSEGGFTLKNNDASSESSESDSDLESDGVGQTESYLYNGSDNESITSSSSDDSFTKDWDEIFQNDVPSRSRIPGLFKTTVGLGNRFISHGNNKSSLNRLTSQGGTASNYKSSAHGDITLDQNNLLKKRSRRHNRKSANVVGIFDFRHLIPDKYELACEYRVLGDSPENLSRYNSAVALKYGLKEISDVWRILEMILIKDVKLNEIHPVFRAPLGNQYNEKSTEMSHLLLTSDFGRKISNNEHYRFYWGTHPFGHTWLIEQIFKYFETQGNIQMLAMLSCILFENTSNIKKTDVNMPNIPINTPYKANPPIPSIVDLKGFNSFNQENNEMFNNEIFRESLNDIKLESKYENHRNSTISNNRKGISEVMDHERSIGSSIDVPSFKDNSPDRHSSLKRNIQHQSLTPFLDLSPANEYSLYPFRGNQKQTRQIRKNSTQLFPGSSKKLRAIQLKRQQIANSFIKNRIRPPPLVTIEMMNAESLDLYDDMYTSLLLNAQDFEKIKVYREHYAEMLFLWGLPINRIKILKFNYPNTEDVDPVSNKSLFEVHSLNFGLRAESRKVGLDKDQIVPSTTIQTARNNPWNTVKRNELKSCSLCNLIVNKRVVVCTSCEHVMHSDCAVEWWTLNEGAEESEQECPSGCSCRCLDYHV